MLMTTTTAWQVVLTAQACWMAANADVATGVVGAQNDIQSRTTPAPVMLEVEEYTLSPLSRLYNIDSGTSHHLDGSPPPRLVFAVAVLVKSN